MKPQVVTGVPATREAIGRAFGARVAALFVPNPRVATYAAVLRFPQERVVTGGELVRALRRRAHDPGPCLVVARDLTLEARRAAAAAGCDVLTEREFGWTDAAVRAVRS